MFPWKPTICFWTWEAVLVRIIRRRMCEARRGRGVFLAALGVILAKARFSEGLLFWKKRVKRERAFSFPKREWS